MVDRFYGYQYDTNPRKLSPEHIPYRNRYSQKQETVTTKSNSSRNTSKLRKNGTQTSLKSRTKTKVEVKKTPEIRKVQIANKENNIQSNVRNDKKTKKNIKPKLKIVMFLITGFSVLFAISYQNSLISESFNRKEQYKKEMEALSKTNQQIEVNIENSLNLNNIEQSAKDKLGMQKLNNNQKIYVSLPKEDYVAPAAEQIIIDEDLGFFEKLIRGFTQSIN